MELFKVHLVVVLIAFLAGCGGGGGSEAESKQDTSSGSTETYKEELVSLGWDCGSTDIFCYKVESGNLKSANTSTMLTTTDSITSSEVVNSHLKAQAMENISGLSYLDSCSITNSNTTYSCLGYVRSTDSAQTYEFNINYPSVDNNKNGIPIDLGSSTITDDGASRIVQLRQGYFESIGYECESGTCTENALDTLNAAVGEQKVNDFDIEACSTADGTCESKSYYQIMSDLYVVNKDPDYIRCTVNEYFDSTITCGKEWGQNETFSWMRLDTYIIKVNRQLDSMHDASIIKSATKSDLNPAGTMVFSGLSDIDTYVSDMNSRYDVKSYLPQFPSVPVSSDYPSLYYELDDYLTQLQNEVVWPQSKIDDIRSSSCFEVRNENGALPNDWVKCYANINDYTIAECDFSRTTDYESCTTHYERPESMKEVFNNFYSIFGFDKVYADGVQHFEMFPVTVYDAAFHMNALYSDRIAQQSVSYQDAFTATQVMHNATNAQMIAASPDYDEWNTDKAHGAAVTGVLAGYNGSYVNTVNRLLKRSFGETIIDQFNDYLAIEKPELVNFSYGVSSHHLVDAKKYLYKSEKHSTSFIVAGAGNSGINWSQFLDVESSDFNANQLSQTLFAGGMNVYEGFKVSRSAYPGENPILQSRFIFASFYQNPTAGVLGNTQHSFIPEAGTSMATPTVARALNLLKNYCQGSSYENLATVLLENADRTFDSYDPEVFGMGRLDVWAAYSYLKSNSCP
ncbi:hypothetical protein DN730_15095 [Marinomonas piezotolerans]|uniref:Peptidase S8/S53 domain-containing protein n=1 Tax=Marinomonas piezotolerans TaxID=2213058 RepID=A0A370U6A4_9GAMM|nr:S8 family serine peptidase [Marinomonas piezotolerans]RDL43300.1 hypothetical protein DN730_15095 [Marinomonas piezotolerans]